MRLTHWSVVGAIVLMPRRSSLLRRLAVLALTASVWFGAGLPVAAVPPDEQPDTAAAASAAAEIAEAQDQANEAAAAFLEAESRLEELEDEAVVLEARRAELRAKVDELRSGVEAAAVARLTQASTAPMVGLADQQEFVDLEQARTLAAAAQESSAVTFDEYENAQIALDDATAELVANQQETTRQRAEYQRLQAEMEAQIEHLEEVEAQRLRDEQVQIELARQRRIEAERRAAEEARRRAEEEARQRAEEEARASAEAQARASQEANALAESSSGGGGGGGGGGGNSNSDSGGGGGGGNSDSGGGGGGGGGGAPAPAPTPERSFSSGGITCPVRGASAYADTWGAPRSGGRSHEGVDLIASTGTPLVAVVSGSARFSQNRLGGNAVWLNGDNGTRYYYAHLSSYEGSSRGVSQGEVIGYVGSTGNTDTPHLHFEVHPGGGAAVNPYPYAVAAGC
jgi:murein DD-endopeptidase MepM/ murein hydrolase activator NlpD